MRYFIPLFCLFLLSFSACTDDEDPIPNGVPIIRVESISPKTAKQFEEPVELVLYYEDANGDLGSEDPDELTLAVKDSRLENPDMYHVKPIAPPGANVPIQGTLSVIIKSVFLLGNGDSEQITFSVRIQDQAGNWSEEAVSPPITVEK